MKIIISPAKKMIRDLDSFEFYNLPTFLNKTQIIFDYLQKLSFTQLQTLWGCSYSIAKENYDKLKTMNLNKHLTPAICSYNGIQYKYMAPKIFEGKMLNYLEDNLRILSGFYGVLKPFDGVTPYRLEMQAKTNINGINGLYDFWGNDLYKAIKDQSNIIVNLASKEYSKCIEKYLTSHDIFITCTFGEFIKGRVVQKATYAKIARGEMVQFMAKNSITKLNDLKEFDNANYKYSEELSSKNEYIFLKK